MYTLNLTGELSSYPLFLVALADGRRHFYQESTKDTIIDNKGNEPHPFSNLRPLHGICMEVPMVQKQQKMHASMGCIWDPAQMKDTEKYMAVGSYTAAQRLVHVRGACGRGRMLSRAMGTLSQGSCTHW